MRKAKLILIKTKKKTRRHLQEHIGEHVSTRTSHTHILTHSLTRARASASCGNYCKLEKHTIMVGKFFGSLIRAINFHLFIRFFVCMCEEFDH